MDRERERVLYMSTFIVTHAPADKHYTNLIPYPFVLRKCSSNPRGYGYGYDVTAQERSAREAVRERQVHVPAIRRKRLVQPRDVQEHDPVPVPGQTRNKLRPYQ